MNTRCLKYPFHANRRCRKMEHNNSPYELVPATLNSYSDSITADLLNKNNGHIFVLKVEGVKVSLRRHFESLRERKEVELN